MARLMNKLNQLVMGASGAPRVMDLTNVYLCLDGRVTARTSTGEKVTTEKLANNCIWRPVKCG